MSDTWICPDCGLGPFPAQAVFCPVCGYMRDLGGADADGPATPATETTEPTGA
ncbi:MAG: hypothetical protein JO127_03425 [Caulobacteraceae bacterium]|nr:hypothetical protein [Caulobacteraceae bacterium]